MIWAISGVLALAGLILLAVAALKLSSGLDHVSDGVDRLQEHANQAQQLQERLNATAADAQRIAETMPGK